MRHYKFLISLFLFFIFSHVYAQNELTERDRNIIQYDATLFIEELELLLNTLSTPRLSRFERDEIIRNSFSGGVNQIFQNSLVIMEDDINPESLYTEKERDLSVERYLKDLDLFYSKYDSATIHFFDSLASPVKQKDYIYVEVYFKSIFNGKHTISNKPYKTTERVATIIATKRDEKWEMKIASVVYYNPIEHPFVKQALEEKKRLEEANEITITKDTSKKIIVIPPVIIEEKGESESDFTPEWDIAPFAGIATNTNLTLGIKARWRFFESLGVQAGFNYFIVSDITENGVTAEQSASEFELNGLYFLNSTADADFNVYLLAGVNYMNIKSTASAENSNSTPSELSLAQFGMNVGVGVDYEITDKILPFAEVKYVLANQLVFGIGLRIKLE